MRYEIGTKNQDYYLGLTLRVAPAMDFLVLRFRFFFRKTLFDSVATVVRVVRVAGAAAANQLQIHKPILTD